MFFVLIATLGGPLAALVLVGVLVACVVRALGTRRAYPSPLMVATFSACVWVLVYTGGVWSGDLAVARAASDLCGPGDYTTSPAMREQVLPLSHTCVLVAGPPRELVPAVVNPLLLATAAIGGVATLAAVVLAHRAARLPGPPAATSP